MLTRGALEWREKELGPHHPSTLAAVYDLSKCLRAKRLRNGVGLEGEGSVGGAAVALDSRWIEGLQKLCVGEGEGKWAEHVVVLGSVAQVRARGGRGERWRVGEVGAVGWDGVC